MRSPQTLVCARPRGLGRSPRGGFCLPGWDLGAKCWVLGLVFGFKGIAAAGGWGQGDGGTVVTPW